MTHVRVWLSHDGYRDPDDNLAMLVGGAQVRKVADASSDVSIAGVVYGDTTDGGQFHMLHPTETTPARFDDDPRFDDHAKNRIAAGNYAFYLDYGAPALKALAPGWQQIDLLRTDKGGQRSWNYHPEKWSDMAIASQQLVSDIREAIGKGMTGGSPKEVVVYSAGGGAHVPAEAIAYLQGNGWSKTAIKEHFAIIQHGRTNFSLNIEPEAREITRAYTIAISKQDPDVYANGMDGPGLGNLVRSGVWLDGGAYGGKFAHALAVAEGRAPFADLGSNKTFRPTTDASDAGSHAFAADEATLLANWDRRLQPGDVLPDQPGTEHLIQNGDSYRLRVIYDEFDWLDARRLMNASPSGAAAEETAATDAASDAAGAAAIATQTAHADAWPADDASLGLGHGWLDL